MKIKENLFYGYTSYVFNLYDMYRNGSLSLVEYRFVKYTYSKFWIESNMTKAY